MESSKKCPSIGVLMLKTPIPFVSDKTYRWQKGAIGTLANCAGGVTHGALYSPARKIMKTIMAKFIA